MLKILITIWFKRSGWRFIGSLPKRIDKTVIVAGPHSSKKDFFLAVAINKLALFNAKILVNQENFRWYNRFFLKSLGAIPYDAENEAKSLIELQKLFRNNRRVCLAMTFQKYRVPGAQRQEYFYDLALEDNAVIVMVALDFKRKQVKFHSFFRPSMDRNRDLQFMQNFFANYKGRHRELDIPRSTHAND